MLEIPISEHIRAFKQALDFPEMREPTRLVETFPLSIVTTYRKYVGVLDQLLKLSPEQLENFRLINTRLGVSGASEFLELLDEEKRAKLPEIVKNICDPTQREYQNGLADLKRMMTNAQKLKLEGARSSDQDPRFEDAIWGFLAISNPRAEIDFVFCHFFERFLAQYGYVQKKDQLLQAMEDVIASSKRNTLVYKTWTTPKPEGLGWISKEKAEAYRQ